MMVILYPTDVIILKVVRKCIEAWKWTFPRQLTNLHQMLYLFSERNINEVSAQEEWPISLSLVSSATLPSFSEQSSQLRINSVDKSVVVVQTLIAFLHPTETKYLLMIKEEYLFWSMEISKLAWWVIWVEGTQSLWNGGVWWVSGLYPLCCTYLKQSIYVIVLFLLKSPTIAAISCLNDFNSIIIARI